MRVACGWCTGGSGLTCCLRCIVPAAGCAYLGGVVRMRQHVNVILVIRLVEAHPVLNVLIGDRRKTPSGRLVGRVTPGRQENED